jgi:hypothetical protein
MSTVVDSTVPTDRINLFTEGGLVENYYAHWIVRSFLPGAHPGRLYAAQHIEVRPVGSGENGPASCDVAQSISAIKQNWTTTNIPGEINGEYLIVRQGGPDAGVPGDPKRSDASAYLANVANIGKTGFAAVLEGVTSNIARGTYVQTAAVRVQIAPLNTDKTGQTGWGFVANAEGGTLSSGFRAASGMGGTWKYNFEGIKEGVGTTFYVTPDGDVLGRKFMPSVKPTVTGSRGGNAALTSLLKGLASVGLIINNTTA